MVAVDDEDIWARLWTRLTINKEIHICRIWSFFILDIDKTCKLNLHLTTWGWIMINKVLETGIAYLHWEERVKPACKVGLSHNTQSFYTFKSSIMVIIRSHAVWMEKKHVPCSATIQKRNMRFRTGTSSISKSYLKAPHNRCNFRGQHSTLHSSHQTT